MDQDIIDEQDQPVFEDVGSVGTVTGNQAMSAGYGYVTIDGEKVPYKDLQDVPGGVGKIMKRKIQ